eukprot:2861358-Prymnesium_polylepis.1
MDHEESHGGAARGVNGSADHQSASLELDEPTPTSKTRAARSFVPLDEEGAMERDHEGGLSAHR